LGYTLSELDDRLSLEEYQGWIQYFEYMNNNEEDKPNLLESEGAMLSGFGL
tara:strand:+ start:355 stop:507 length:153 start_codon:yes stop_codon:yes gene_type:complete